ncbi:MAG TPA: glycogen/starch synthase, partial [Syntrophomonas sp.]|nr:glycogen/starch synthase [Syntrophomonas sp.]
MLSWEYPPHMVGGLGQHVYDISRYLVMQNVEVHIITPRV